MSQRINPQEITLLQAKAGWEGELSQIFFVLVEDGKITSSKHDAVLTIFGNTTNGVSCVNDNSNDKDYFSELKRVANNSGLTISSHFKDPHIFEFITSPNKDVAKLGKQFDEITRLETDLIYYILEQKRKNPNVNFICVGDWIKEYNENRCFTDKPLASPECVNSMYILVDYSIAKMKKFVNPMPEGVPIDNAQLAALIQKKLDHSVQYNFVAALGKKMGSVLVDIFDANNSIGNDIKQLKLIQKKMGQALVEVQKRGYTDSELNLEVKKFQEQIRYWHVIIDDKQKRKRLLYLAENNAEKTCQFIRENISENRKLAKLEGFFFLLSLRILTETSFVQSTASTSKNKYLFYLKTKLSNLIHSLSENDKKLLHDIKGWSPEQKNLLYIAIAGSAEALTVNFSKNKKESFTIKDVIESTLGWSQNDICDFLPNAPTKPIESTLEPSMPQIRSKKHPEELNRVLLEYRASARQNVATAEQEMLNTIFQATQLSKTTYLHKKDGTQLGLGLESEVKELANEEFFEKNVNQALQLIKQCNPFPQKETTKYKQIKSKLDAMLSHDERDITLKQINYVFVKLNSADVLINELLIELYSDKINNFFTFPLKTPDDRYYKYIQQRYALTSKVMPIKIDRNDANQSGLQSSSLFSGGEIKLTPIEKFKNNMTIALAEYKKDDRLKRKEKVSEMLNLAPEVMNPDTIEQLLDNINEELNRTSLIPRAGKSSSLRDLLNPHLLEMLKKLPGSNNKKLEKDFSSHLRNSAIKPKR